MKDELKSLLKKVVVELGIKDVDPEVEISDNATHGEYTSNLALRIASHPILKKQNPQLKSPRDVALWVKKQLDQQLKGVTHDIPHHNTEPIDQKQSSKKVISSVLQDIERVEVAGPGFLNFFLSKVALISRSTQALKERESFGTTKTLTSQVKKIMVEYTDPNPFKELHIGHLYSNAVGESLARIFEALGAEVKRADYFGDVGMHVAKSIWGMRELMSNQTNPTNLTNLEQKTLSERVHWLGQAYTLGATAYEAEQAKPEDKQAMEEINLLVYVAAQGYMAKTFNWKPVVDYGKLLPSGALNKLGEVRELFEKGREWSMAYFETIFRRLGTKFDYYYPESLVGEYGAKLVREHLRDGVFTESEGAVIFEGEKIGLHTRVFMNSKGLPTYEAKELGLNSKKYQDFPFDLSLIVTGKEIDEYFRVLFAAMERVIPEVASKTKHLGHGMVRLPEGKMSSRTGQILTGEWLLSEVKRRIIDYLGQTEAKYTKAEQEEIAEKVAIAAIKYSFLRVALPADIAFDFEKSLSFEGESGPYLLYTYARCRSVMRKAQSSGQWTVDSSLVDLLSTVNCKLNTEERSIARLISYYPEIVVGAGENYAPNTLCTYLFNLAQTFNLFYQKHSILGKDKQNVNQLRLALTGATAQVLHNGLFLLGIATVEKM